LAGPLAVLAASFTGPPPPVRKRWLTLPIVAGFIVASTLAIVLLRSTALIAPGAVVPRREALWLAAAVFGGGGALVLSMALGLVFTIATFVTLARAYRDSGPEARRQIRWPIWGIATGLAGPFIISIFIGLLMVFTPGGPSRAIQDLSELVTAPLSLLIPASFVFAILKYRLMEIDVVIRKTLIYATVTGLLVVAYAVLVGGLGGWFVQAAGVKSQWVTAFGTVVVAVLFVPARNRIQGLVDRRFFRTRYEIADSLKRMSTAVAEARRAPALMRVAAEEAQQALSSRTIVVFGWHADSRTLAAAETIGLSDERRRTLRLALDAAVLGALTFSTSLETRALTGPLGGLARHADAELLVPALHRGELRAVLAVGGKLSDEELSEADREFLVALAAQLASGLAGIEAGARDRELDEARDIQAGLLPRELPRVTGYDLAAHWQPAREVAGDLYDAYPVGDRVALCVADVTGKGMPAALLMSSLQATVRGVAAQGLSPAALGERVNRVISAQITPGRFITMFFATLDPASGVVTYVNAGHNPPMLLRAGGKLELLDAGGLLLGIMPEATYVEAQVTLHPGDRLLLFTDGITEAADTTQDLFGEARLETVLRAGAADDAAGLQRRVLEEVSAFCQGDFQDDATLIVVVAR
ncbi:MAG: GAF domain-containing SpoIIE family protein phosphatase, partial [Candidatus Eisenbacteria bacterium]